MLGGTSKWDIIGSRPAGDLSNLKAYVRRLGRSGIPVIFLGSRCKEPIDLRSLQMERADTEVARQAAKVAGNPRWAEVKTRAGIQLATTDVKRLERYADRAMKWYPDSAPNLATTVGNGLVLIDADWGEGVEAFCKRHRTETGDGISSTVLTPGVQNPDGTWKHRDGGHIYLQLPEGCTLPEGAQNFSVGEGKSEWTVFVRDHYILIPPSVRPEGLYRWVGTVHIAPDWVIRMIEEEAARRRTVLRDKAIRAEQRSESGPSNIDLWAAATEWSDLLESDGWDFTGCTTACGCPEATAPGTHASLKSATAHEPGCTQTDTSSGHGPLHVWTSNPPPGISDYAKSTGSSTLTKLQYFAWTHHGGNEAAAVKALGITGGTTIGGASAEELLEAAGLNGQPQPEPNPFVAAAARNGVPQPDPAGTASPSVEDDLDDTPEGYRGVTRIEDMDETTQKLVRMLPLNRHFDPYDKNIYPAGFHSAPDLLEKIFNFSDVTRTIFHKARSRKPRSVHPMPLLLQEMERRGTRCPVTCRLWPGTPLSTFMVVGGRSGLGKSESAKPDASPWQQLKAPPLLEKDAASKKKLSPDNLARYLAAAAVGLAPQPVVPLNPMASGGSGNGSTIADPIPVLIPHDFDETISLGSGQVLSDHLIEEIGKGEDLVIVMCPHPCAFIADDEMTTMLAAAKGDASTIISTLNTAWAGLPLGNTTRAHGDRRTPGPYSVFIATGLQPKLGAQLFCHDGSGFLQRFVFVASADPYKFVGAPDIPVPLVLPTGAMPHITSGSTFTADPRVITEVEDPGFDYELDHLFDDYAEKMSHTSGVRIRIACLGALLHNTLHITWEIWEWTGWIMEHSRRVFMWMEVQAENQEQTLVDKVVKRQASAKISGQAAVEEKTEEVAESVLAKITAAGEEGIAWKKLRSGMAPGRRDFLKPALDLLAERNLIYKDKSRYKLIGYKTAS
jgi:hypothetical protein